MSTVKNLWGELPPVDAVRAPVVILREQAAKLTELTNSALQGDVFTSKTSAGDIYHALRIVVPALDNYVYTILYITHGIILYPLGMKDEVNVKQYKCDDENDFITDVEIILSSTAVHKSISALLAQSKAESTVTGL